MQGSVLPGLRLCQRAEWSCRELQVLQLLLIHLCLRCTALRSAPSSSIGAVLLEGPLLFLPEHLLGVRRAHLCSEFSHIPREQSGRLQAGNEGHGLGSEPLAGLLWTQSWMSAWTHGTHPHASPAHQYRLRAGGSNAPCKAWTELPSSPAASPRRGAGGSCLETGGPNPGTAWGRGDGSRRAVQWETWERRELGRLGGERRADSRVDFCLSGYYTVDLKRQMTAVAEEAIIESAMKH